MGCNEAVMRLKWAVMRLEWAGMRPVRPKWFSRGLFCVVVLFDVECD